MTLRLDDFYILNDQLMFHFNTNGASSIDIIFKHFYSSDDDVTVDQCLSEWNLLKYNLIKMKEDLPSELDLNTLFKTSDDFAS
jgi:hypothetical protein